MAEPDHIVLVLDKPVSRRKRFHHVCTPEGEVLWSGNKSSEAWDFIIANGADEIHITSPSGMVVVEKKRVLPW